MGDGDGRDKEDQEEEALPADGSKTRGDSVGKSRKGRMGLCTPDGSGKSVVTREMVSPRKSFPRGEGRDSRQGYREGEKGKCGETGILVNSGPHSL